MGKRENKVGKLAGAEVLDAIERELQELFDRQHTPEAVDVAAKYDADRIVCQYLNDWLAPPQGKQGLEAGESWRGVFASRAQELAARAKARIAGPGGPCVKEPPNTAIQAYLLYTAMGITQADVADELSTQYRRKISQGQVSKWVAEVRRFYEATGLPTDSHGKTRKVIPVDPSHLDKGRRTDGRPTRG